VPYNWKAKYGGLDMSEGKRLRPPEDENRKLKQLLAEAMLDSAALPKLLSRNGEDRSKGCGSYNAASLKTSATSDRVVGPIEQPKLFNF